MYRKEGLRVAVDDFGAGFSQLERVIAIQPDIIKLDMRLFQNAARGGVETDVVHLLTRLAKRTGCRIVCEGVETDEDFLFGLNCGAQYMQGYLFSPATANFGLPIVNN
jgi:EAL domain-containing protein (putative c-di-GMP-specific phosphodiesterase class I)